LNHQVEASNGRRRRFPPHRALLSTDGRISACRPAGIQARVTFATLASDGLTANIKFAPDEQALKCAVAPDAFAPLDNAWGRRGWTRATRATLAALRAALEIAWRRGSAKPLRRGATLLRPRARRG